MTRWLSMMAVLVVAGAGSADDLHRNQRHYSPIHYWAPTWVRVHAWMHPPRLPIYAPDTFPGVPRPSTLAVYPVPPVPTDSYYRGTGLPYDPAEMRSQPRFVSE